MDWQLELNVNTKMWVKFTPKGKEHLNNLHRYFYHRSKEGLDHNLHVPILFWEFAEILKDWPHQLQELLDAPILMEPLDVDNIRVHGKLTEKITHKERRDFDG
jgi:hypothetical protein